MRKIEYAKRIEKLPFGEDHGFEQCVRGETEDGTKVGAVLDTVAGPLYEWCAVPDNVPSCPSMVYFGKRRTGKSTSLMNVMFHTMQHIPFGIVMSNTAFAGYFEQFVPKRFIFQGLRQDILDNLVSRQKRLIRQYGKDDERTHAFIILDDVVADQKTIRYNADLQGFFVEGRHLNITVLITTQHVKGVGPMVRGNCDLVFLQPVSDNAPRVRRPS